jgi:hypothetical protein
VHADAENMSKIPLDMDGDAGGDNSEVDEEVFALEGAERPRITIRQKTPLVVRRSACRRCCGGATPQLPSGTA